MPHIVSQFVAFVQLVIPYWPIVAAVIAAIGIWQLYKAWKRQYESQQMPKSGYTPEYCTCSLKYGHKGPHRG